MHHRLTLSRLLLATTYNDGYTDRRTTPILRNCHVAQCTRTTHPTTLYVPRVRENMNTTLTKKFVDEMKIYQQSQQQYKTDIKKKVKRQVQVVKPDATDEEVDAVMKSEGGRDALYKERILAGGVNDQIKYVLLLRGKDEPF